MLDIPFFMLLIALPTGAKFPGTELSKSLGQLQGCPVEPVLCSANNIRVAFFVWRKYLGYELSPKPNTENSTEDKQSGESFLRRSFFQNSLELAGRSPCPVVATLQRSSVPCAIASLTSQHEWRIYHIQNIQLPPHQRRESEHRIAGGATSYRFPLRLLEHFPFRTHIGPRLSEPSF